EGFRIHTTIDGELQKVAEESLRQNLEKAEQHPGYDHQTYAEYAVSFRQAKSNGTTSAQPALEYLQGAVIGLDNETGGILVLVGGRDFEHNQYNGATVRIGTDAGLDEVLQLCRTAGIRSTLRPYPATLLGSSEVTLAELALAYTIFPNGGSRPIAPHILERIEEKDGTVWHAQRD